MNTKILAIPTKYNGVQFRSRLEATWAAFFDLIGCKWEYEPFELPGWFPDFKISFPCGHSECNENHILLCEVKPYSKLEDFQNHPANKYYFIGGAYELEVDAIAFLGSSPACTQWQMAHGHGGGEYSILDWFGHLPLAWAWKEARNRTQWRKKNA